MCIRHKDASFLHSGHSSGYDSRSARAFPYGNGKLFATQTHCESIKYVVAKK